MLINMATTFFDFFQSCCVKQNRKTRKKPPWFDTFHFFAVIRMSRTLSLYTVVQAVKCVEFPKISK